MLDFGLAFAGPLPLPPFSVLGFVIEPFGALAAVAIVVGFSVAHARARVLGLSENVLTRLCIIAVVAGFSGSHLVYVFGYAPQTIVDDPLYLLKIWTGMSSVGGWIGGYVGVAMYFAFHRRIPFLPYADAIAYGLAFAWVFARAGCWVSFDHPGLVTDLFIGMEYPGSASLTAGVRHNVGFYEFLWCLLIAGIFFSQRDRIHFKGWYMTVFILAYVPFRFPIDFLREVDARYLGLSPGQWLLPGFASVLMALAIRERRRADLLIPDGIPKPEFFPDGAVPAPVSPDDSRPAP